MFSTRRSIAVLAIAGALGFAGCGDDDNDTSTTTTTPPEPTGATGATGESGSTGSLPADVAAEGNEICTEGNNELNKAFGQAGGVSEEDFVNETVVPNIQGQIDDLREIDDSDELQSVLDDAEDILADIEADPQLFYDDSAFKSINDDLRALGLTVCGE